MATVRFHLPLLQSGQAQKEWTHNEGLQGLEHCVQPVVDGPPVDTPPTNPAVGRQFIVGANPTGDFAAARQQLATWTESGWLFTLPTELFVALDRRTGMAWTFEEGNWTSGVIKATEIRIGDVKVLGAQQPGIAEPSGGQVSDQEARSAVTSILHALRQHGIIAA